MSRSNKIRKNNSPPHAGRTNSMKLIITKLKQFRDFFDLSLLTVSAFTVYLVLCSVGAASDLTFFADYLLVVRCSSGTFLSPPTFSMQGCQFLFRKLN